MIGYYGGVRLTPGPLMPACPGDDRPGEKTDDGSQAASTGEAETLKDSLETFAGVNPDLHKRLVREVRAGISAQEMEVDYD